METTNDNLIDKQLYISMQQGNKKAFDTLFIKYYAMLCAFARSFVSLEDAEEVVQDTMLQIWENRKTNHIDSSVHHYLFKAVKNKCYTLMTRNSLRFQIENILTPDIQELFEDPDFYIIEELTQKIEKAILNLPESYRVAFEMHRFQNKTIIARTTSCLVTFGVGDFNNTTDWIPIDNFVYLGKEGLLDLTLTD